MLKRKELHSEEDQITVLKRVTILERRELQVGRGKDYSSGE